MATSAAIAFVLDPVRDVDLVDLQSEVMVGLSRPLSCLPRLHASAWGRETRYVANAEAVDRVGWDARARVKRAAWAGHRGDADPAGAAQRRSRAVGLDQLVGVQGELPQRLMVSEVAMRTQEAPYSRE